MKIAVSSAGQTLHDELDLGFGRCPGFLIYDTETQSVFFLDNTQNRDLPQGAGTSAAQMIGAEGVDVLISGNIGPNALQALNQANIEVFASTAKTVQEAIQAWDRNELQRVSSAASLGGAGQGMGRGGGRKGRGPSQGGQGKGGGAKGRGPGQGGQGQGGGARGKGPGQGGRGRGEGSE
ncbi:MAG: NifB/NifX family molybdenum-iron cluster-binding protein [Desulfohalobiaceae bacterium]